MLMLNSIFRACIQQAVHASSLCVYYDLCGSSDSKFIEDTFVRVLTARHVAMDKPTQATGMIHMIDFKGLEIAALKLD